MTSLQIENWQNLQPHPLANLVPRMTTIQQTALNKDIKDKGLQFPIVVVRKPGSDPNSHVADDFEMLDGRNRHEACVVEKIDPYFSEYYGDDPSGFVISTLQRKDLTWAEKTGAIKNLLAQGTALSSRAIAKQFGVGNKTVDKLRHEMQEAGQLNGPESHSGTGPDLPQEEWPAPGGIPEVSPPPVTVERVTKAGRRAPGRKPDTPEVKAAKAAAKLAKNQELLAAQRRFKDADRKPISSARETRIDFVNSWLAADVAGALTDILQLASNYDGLIQAQLSGAVRRQHLTKWAKLYGYSFTSDDLE